MYLSKLFFNPLSKNALKHVENPYMMHQFIKKAFANNDVERILFRIEAFNKAVKAFPVLVQSSIEKPDWSFQSNGMFSSEPLVKFINEDKQFNFEAGQLLRFKLSANPVKKIKGKKISLYKEDEQYKWLQINAGKGGFEIEAVSISSFSIGDYNKFIKAGKDEIEKKEIKKAELFHLGAHFTGQLRISDATKFKKALLHGIGSAKSFGFGMLLIAPA